MYFDTKRMRRLSMTIATAVLLGMVSLSGIATGEETEESVTIKVPFPAVEASVQDIVMAGNTAQMYRYYAFTLFNKSHPNITIEPAMENRVWNSAELLFPLLAAGDGPAVYRMGAFGSTTTGVPNAVSMGAAADITEYVEDSEFKRKYSDHWSKMTKEIFKARCYVDGRAYAVTTESQPMVVLFRKDWLKEAGVFNTRGEPAPNDDWTFDDFRQISMKITNPKKDHWGLTYRGDSLPRALITRFGAESLLVIPDKSGKNTWEAGFNLAPWVNFFKFIQAIKWEDKTFLSSVDMNWGAMNTAFHYGHRAGFYERSIAGPLQSAGMNVPDFAPMNWSDAAGISRYPTGQTLEPNVFSASFLVNPAQTDAQIKASVEFLGWYWHGQLQVLYSLNRYFEQGKWMEQPPNYAAGGGWYGAPYAPWMDNPKQYLPSDFIATMEIMANEPIGPTLGGYGLTVNNQSEVESALLAAYQVIISDPDADVETELTKAAKIANQSLDYKLDSIDAEKLEAYYTARAEYYQETVPNFYENTYKEVLENLKVW